MPKIVELQSVYSTIPSSCLWCGVEIYRIFDELGGWMIYEKGHHLKNHACEPFNQWVEANKDILGFTSMSLCRTRFQLWLAGREVAERWLKELQNLPSPPKIILTKDVKTRLGIDIRRGGKW